MKYKTTITEISERDLIGNLRLKLIITFLLLSSLTGFSQCTDSTIRPEDGFTLQGCNPTFKRVTDGYINIADITSSSPTSPNANRPKHNSFLVSENKKYKTGQQLIK